MLEFDKDTVEVANLLFDAWNCSVESIDFKDFEPGETDHFLIQSINEPKTTYKIQVTKEG